MIDAAVVPVNPKIWKRSAVEEKGISLIGGGFSATSMSLLSNVLIPVLIDIHNIMEKSNPLQISPD